MLKGSDDLYYNAEWNADCAYALNIENGLDKETLMKIVESVDYPHDTSTEMETGEVSDMHDAETDIVLEFNSDENKAVGNFIATLDND